MADHDTSVIDDALIHDDDNKPGDSSSDEMGEVSDEEQRRRSFQSKADRLENENKELRQSLNVLQGKVDVLTSTVGSSGKQALQEKVVNSPQDLMVDGAQFDSADAYTTGTPSYEARIRYERANAEHLAKSVVKEVISEMDRRQSAQVYQTARQNLLTKYKLDTNVWNEFEQFVGNENSVSTEEVFRIFLLKTGRALNSLAQVNEQVSNVSTVGQVVEASPVATSRKPLERIDKEMSVFPDDPFAT